MNSFNTKSTLDVSGRSLTYFSLQSERLEKFGVDRLPFSIKILLENLLRHEDGVKVTASDIEALARWADTPSHHGEAAGDDAREIAFTPGRVLMQDLTGVPAVVDLAAMRDAMKNLGGNPEKINPLVPAELGHLERGGELAELAVVARRDDQLAVVRGVVVILHQPLADLTGGDADYGVGIGVITGGAAKDFNADAAFLEFGATAFQGLLNGVSEQNRIALAI